MSWQKFGKKIYSTHSPDQF